MKIAYITAGAGGMYCGSCLRDNALAAALMARGHEVLLLPTYTPTRTDEPNVSGDEVFLGGINVYLQQNYPIFRRTPRLLDKLLDLRPLLRLATRWGLRIEPAYLGEMTASMLRGTGGFLSKEVRRIAVFLRNEVSPDIVNLPNSLLVGLAPEIKAQLGRPICCTLQGEDLFLDGLTVEHRDECLRLIREKAAHIDAFLAVNKYYADYMSAYLGLERAKIRVAPLGINLTGHAPPDGAPPGPFHIGYLARIAPEKGLHLLCEAYRLLLRGQDLPPSRLGAAGYLAAEHRGYLGKIRLAMEDSGLSDRFTYHGELSRERKIAFLRSLHVLSVPTPFSEPKGIYVLEAMANGVPVVQPRIGAFPEIIESTGGGVLVPPNDPAALAEAIHELWKDPARRATLGRNGSEGVRRHFSAESMADKVMHIYQELCRPPDGRPTG